MSRANRRYFDKAFPKVIRENGDLCGLCGHPLVHNTKTYGGFDFSYNVLLVGDCCVHRMKLIMASGIYLARNTDVLDVINLKEKTGRASPETAAKSLELLQSFYAGLDRMSDETLRKAGLANATPDLVDIAESPWKDDDAEWFRSHPTRSHRLRLVYPGEAESVVGIANSEEIPSNHRLEILVRQVQVGRRLRIAFYRNLGTPIPDVEEVIHAIFDMVSEHGRRGVILTAEVLALADKYHRAMTGKPN